MKIRILGKRNMFVEVNDKGERVNASRGDVLSVPKDVSQKTALKLLNRGTAEVVKETKEKAVKEKRKKAVKK